MIWQHVSKQNPCPICNSTDWCTFGDRAMLCQRVPSEHAHPKAGHYHFYETNVARPDFIPKAKEAPKSIDATKMMRKWRSETKDASFHILANQLGVNYLAAIAIGAAYSVDYSAWAFPMRDGYGETIGIRLRSLNGFKWAVTGSREGIFIPEASVHATSPVYLPEGPTDTMAALSLGLFAIGRPTCKTGVEHIKIALKRLGIFKAVVVADNDDLKKLGPREGRPGIEGALKLKKDLGLPSIIWQPTGPIKDIRDYVKRGGSRALIEQQGKDRVWSRK